MKSEPSLLGDASSGSNVLRGLLRWGPVILWAAGIFYFSSRRYPLGSLSQSDQKEVFGRISHVAEYAGLTALLHRALIHNRTKRRTVWLSLLGSLAYAAVDEVHQSFVPGRTCSPLDVGFDLVGALFALGLIWLGERSLESLRGHQG